MTAQHNQNSPFADGPAANDAAESGTEERTPEEGTPIPSRFGAPLARMLPIPTRLGHPLPSTSGPQTTQAQTSQAQTNRAQTNRAQAVDAPSPAAGHDAPAGTGESAARSEPALGAINPYADESVYADTFYGQIGGHATFAKMIHVFYEGVASDPLLRALYPEEDLAPAERRMLMFMEQYWGGPRTYLEERGHPRLRMRHVHFAVTPEARDRWLAAMRKGVDAVELAPLHDATLWDYLERAAASLVNAPSDPSQRA